MPRRGGRDRYRSSKHARADLERQREKYPHLFPRTDGLGAVITVSVNGGPPKPVLQGGIALCRCGVPWTICERCSKRVSHA